MKCTGVRLKYFKKKTEDMLEFFEAGIRGGVSTVLGCRLVKCNNQDTNPSYKYYKNLRNMSLIKL